MLRPAPRLAACRSYRTLIPLDKWRLPTKVPNPEGIAAGPAKASSHWAGPRDLHLPPAASFEWKNGLRDVDKALLTYIKQLGTDIAHGCMSSNIWALPYTTCFLFRSMI